MRSAAANMPAWCMVYSGEAMEAQEVNPPAPTEEGRPQTMMGDRDRRPSRRPKARRGRGRRGGRWCKPAGSSWRGWSESLHPSSERRAHNTLEQPES